MNIAPGSLPNGLDLREKLGLDVFQHLINRKAMILKYKVVSGSPNERTSRVQQ
ncbi:hypothetical protein HanXRQr2_Chr13g0585271 [Helianthus annuus]|uniref:Uncharacterized protein n=1 Tax=Helianthus annuus TaxID=4232 RepID=A0A9K3EIZ9_HELAN|nr:hypothetical protein HanXRQr2_Chr13g0585271 [Helianthus annuus]KAJ0848960.1 hypothetical protein HanPSC8_Chr13g0563471 [Helianthus annuus]